MVRNVNDNEELKMIINSLTPSVLARGFNWDVKEIHSTTISNGTAVSSQLYDILKHPGNELQHVFDYKVGKLRALLTADEDITAELHHVVYRLVKLALRTSKERNSPPPATWLQCKLLELLTLTERSIERRKRHYFNKNPLPIQPTDFQENLNVEKVSNAEDSDMVKEIVDKYCHLIQPSENTDDLNGLIESYVPIEVEDGLSTASSGMVNIFDNNDENSSSPTRIHKHLKIKTRERKSPTGRQWKNDNYSGVSSSGDTDHSFKTDLRSSSRRAGKRFGAEMDNVYHHANISAKRRKLSNRHYKINEICGVRNDRKRLLKSFIGKKNLRWYLLKNNISAVKYEHYKIGIKKIVHQNRPLNTFIKPVSTINLRQRGVNKDLLYTLKNDLINSNNESNKESIAVTEESCILEIITDGMNETIALRRTIATDSYDDSFEIKEQLSPSSNEMMPEEKTNIQEDVESNHIFLYDVNEPSTSKGIRHHNMDVQCGSDDVLSPMLSPVTSLHRIPGIIANNVNDCYFANAKPRQEHLECNVLGNNKKPVEEIIVNYKIKSNGIQIKDSEVLLHNSENISAKIDLDSDLDVVLGSNLKNIDTLETVKVSNVMESKKFYSEVVASSVLDAENEIETVTKSIYENNNVIADFISDGNKENNLKNNDVSPVTNVKRKLICGGIFVHSYKDRATCEDILYQGKWQRSALGFGKTNQRHVLPEMKSKNHIRDVIPQKVLEKTRIKNQKCINYTEKNKIQTSNVHKVSSNNKKRPVVASTPIKCNDKNTTLASSKIPLSLVICDNTKKKHNTLPVSKPLVSSIKENKTMVNLKKKNKPHYLKKYISKSLEKIADQINNAEKIPVTNDDLVTSSKTNFKQELLRYVCDPSYDITYSVFRNQIENKKGSDDGELVIKEMNSNNEDKTPSNFQSANSSCSSDNSIATIKQLSPLNKDLQSKEKFMSTKCILRKNAKKSSPIKNDTETCKRSTFRFENKENYPESSRCKDNFIKENTQGPVKTIRRPQNTISNVISNMSNAKNKKDSDDINRNLCVSSVTLCKKVLLPHSMQYDASKQSCAKMPLKVDPEDQTCIPQFRKKLPIKSLSQSTEVKNPEINSRTNKSVCENTNVEEIANDQRDLYDDVKTMIEERLNFTEHLLKTKIPASSDNQKTTPENYNKICDKSSVDKSCAEDSATNSWRSGPEPVYVDLISFKSFASISGFSEYYYADNKFNSTLDSIKILTPPVRSVHDIFERNDQLRITNSVGLMGTPGFSRFSINETMIGDQPDYVNLIDSETGSLAHCVEVRRAGHTYPRIYSQSVLVLMWHTQRHYWVTPKRVFKTSEEVFTSSRSSDTYVSCHFDDDSVVPHWLFRMNNRQHSDEEQSTPALLPVPLPTVAPQLDVNGNIAEQGIGVAGGAGDGRGIHSDRDSSGRDTSLSSTDTSSEQQNEALMVDPPGFASNMEFLREPSSRPFLQIPSTSVSHSSFRTAEGSANDNIYNMTEGTNRNALIHETITSDRDADVSSLDTDIADFSDN